MVTFGNQPDAPFDLAKLNSSSFGGVMMVRWRTQMRAAIPAALPESMPILLPSDAFSPAPDLPQRLRLNTSLNEVDYNAPFYTPCWGKGLPVYPTRANKR